MSTPAPISSLSCPKCEHAFRAVPGGDHGDLRPFLIPTCGHTVCGACASAQAVALSKERSGIFLACPMCGEGASGDAMLNSLISFATEAKYPGKQAGPAHVLCKYCFSDGCVVPATHVCIDCNGEDRASCDDHAIPHRKRAHASLVPVSEYKGVLLSASDAASVSTMCVSHSDYKLDRFCLKCETLVCAECCLTSHPLSHHIVRDVASVSDTLRSQLSDLMTEARAVADTTAARAAAVAEACAGMTEDFNASRESFKTWIEASVAALRSLESDVIEAGQAALRSKTNTLRAQSRALSVSSLQLLEMLSLIGEADVGDPAHVANVYSLLKRVVAGTSAKLFTGPAVSPVVRIGFDPSLVTSALEYCAWIVKDDRANCVSVDSRVAAAMVGLSTAVESCSAASKAAMEVLSRVTGTASKVMSDLAGVREAFTAKVDRVKTAIDVAAAAALCELNGVAEDRLALLGQQEKEVRQACGRLGLAACEGKAALLSGDASRVLSAVDIVKGAVTEHGSVCNDVAPVPVSLDVLFDESAVMSTLRMTVKKHDVCFEACELSGSGLESFVGGGVAAEGAREQNLVKLVCKDDMGGVVESVDTRDVSLRVLSVGGGAGGDGVAGEVASIARDGPGVFSCMYVVESDDVDAVDVDVRVRGERVARSPVRVPCCTWLPTSALLFGVPAAILHMFTTGIKSWLPDAAGKPVLLFRMSRNGSGTSDFHSRCDGKASTVVLIKSRNGFVFGGYAGAAWHSGGAYIPCAKAFIFTVSNPHGIPPTRYLVSDPQRALRGYPQHGPMFGGNGMYVGGSYSLASQSATPFTHYTDSTGKGPATFTGTSDGDFIPAEVEVWQVPMHA